MKTQPGRSLNAGFIFAAFVIGVAGTAFFMSRRGDSPKLVVALNEQAPQGHDGHGGEEHRSIKLSAEARETAGIRVEPARMMLIGESLVVPGTVEVSPNREVKVTPPAPGKVLKLLVNLGETVKAGQAVAVLDSYDVAQAQASVRQAEAVIQQANAAIQTASAETGQARAGMRQAEAGLEQTRTKQRSAEQTLQRQRELAAVGAFAQAPLQAAQQELTEAQSELLNAQKEDAAHEVVLARTERLFSAELVSRQELDQERLHHEQDHIRVERAKARADLAQRALVREKRIADAGLLNAREVQVAEAEVRAAQGDVFKAQQGVSLAQQDIRRAQKIESAAKTSLYSAEGMAKATRANLHALAGIVPGDGGGLLTLRAPISGIVTERLVTLGQAVERGTNLFVIENLHSVHMIANVPERDVSQIRIGQSVEVTVAAYPSERFSGVVQSLGGRVDEKTRALPIRCLIENRSDQLRPEMFANVHLAIGERGTALAIPINALDEHGDEKHIYVDEDGSFERRAVRTGRRTSTHVEILEGLKPGECVAVEGVFVLESEAKKDELKGHED